MLATLVRIATPRYGEGVEISGDDGPLLGPFGHRYFYGNDSDLFYVIVIHMFCDCPCSDSVQLGACQILFERSEFLIATSKKKKTDRLRVCVDVRICFGFSVEKIVLVLV